MKLSVIIPTLNEAKYIGGTIDSIKNRTSNGVYEIIVVDSGSVDATVEIAEEKGAMIIENIGDAPGVSSSLNKGAARARGDVLLFLDADSFVPPGFDSYIRQALGDPNVVGGAFEFSLDGDEFGLRVVELINRIRYRIRKRFYGDQGIFVRASVFNKVGGYPSRRILEAAYMCAKLQQSGELKLVKQNMLTSPRRFIQGGVYTVLLTDIKIWFLDLLGFDVERYASDYWSENVARGKS